MAVYARVCLASTARWPRSMSESVRACASWLCQRVSESVLEEQARHARECQRVSEPVLAGRASWPCQRVSEPALAGYVRECQSLC